MRAIATVLVALLVALGTASTASAESRPGVNPTSRCVTPSEFYSIDKGGKTRAEADAILDWSGANSWDTTAHTWGHRLYRGCNGTWANSTVHVLYKNGRVDYAAWVILN